MLLWTWNRLKYIWDTEINTWENTDSALIPSPAQGPYFLIFFFVVVFLVLFGTLNTFYCGTVFGRSNFWRVKHVECFKCLRVKICEWSKEEFEESKYFRGHNFGAVKIFEGSTFWRGEKFGGGGVNFFGCLWTDIRTDFRTYFWKEIWTVFRTDFQTVFRTYLQTKFQTDYRIFFGSDFLISFQKTTIKKEKMKKKKKITQNFKNKTNKTDQHLVP